MKKISVKWDLIWLDVKSWMISCVLMFSPLALGAITTYVEGKELGPLGVTILSALGGAFKLFQKWVQSSAYIITEEVK